MPDPNDLPVYGVAGSTATSVPAVRLVDRDGTPLNPLKDGGSGDVSSMSVKATGGSRSRAIADRAADTLNPLDFAPAGSDLAAIQGGAADAAPAFKAAIASRPAGAAVRLVVPFGSYRLISDDVVDAGRIVTIDLQSGAKVGIDHGVDAVPTDKRLYVSRIEEKFGEGLHVRVQGSGKALGAALGQGITVINDGSGGYPSTGETHSYLNVSTAHSTPSGGDIGRYTVSSWPQLSGAGLLANWAVGVSPDFTAQPAGKSFGLAVFEINPVHQGPETGVTEFDIESSVAGVGVPGFHTTGVVLKPETWLPNGHKGRHINAGFSVVGSYRDNAGVPTPYRPKTYVPFLAAANSIAPGGYGHFVGGSKRYGAGTTGNPFVTPGVADRPATPFKAKYAFVQGIDLAEATFDTGRALTLAPGHTITWGTGTTAASISADTAGKVTITAPGGLVRPADAWTAWTPTVTPYAGTLSGLSASGAYRYVPSEKRVDFTLSFSAAPSQTTGGFTVGFPVVTGPSKFAYSGYDEATGIALAARSDPNGSGVYVTQYDGSPFSAAQHIVTVSGSYRTS